MVEAGYSVFAHDHLFHGESEPANPCHINRYVIIDFNFKNNNCHKIILIAVNGNVLIPL